MREVEFNTDGELRHNHIKSKLKAGRHFLKINEKYTFNGAPFYIMNGSGLLPIEKFPQKKPSFKCVKVENLAHFIKTGEHSSLDYREQAEIELFYTIMLQNETHKKPVLYNNAFIDLERKLFGLDFEDGQVMPY